MIHRILKKPSVFRMDYSEQLLENAKALLEVILKAKPASSKGTYMKKVALSTTMGPGLRVDPNSASSAKAA